MKTNKPLVIGHRGAHGLAPENTLAGFKKALEYDVDMIETDIRQTADGVLVHIHDAFLVSPDGSKLEVAMSTYDQLRQRKPDLMTLGESINFVDRRVRLMLEVKLGTPTAPVISTVRKFLKRGWQPADFMFAAFDFRVLRELQQALPEIELVVLDTWAGLRAMRRAYSLHTRYISLDQAWVWWGLISSYRRRGYELFVYPYPKTRWLPYNNHKPARWLRRGLYGVITDYPNYFAPVKRRASQ